jgi:hypothetical protein
VLISTSAVAAGLPVMSSNTIAERAMPDDRWVCLEMVCLGADIRAGKLIIRTYGRDVDVPAQAAVV